MGRRKSKRSAPPTKAKLVLEQIFDCPFCNHEKSCEVTMDKERNTGRVQCTKCFEDYQGTINFLSEPIDIYNEWVDACEAANS